MSDSPDSGDDDEAIYRIGAVCRLTGLSQHVLRVWEKRYAVVQPARGANRRRLYRERDVRRLSLLKMLVDRGQAIGSIAQLDDAELTRRLNQSGKLMSRPANREKPRLALVGHALALPREDFSRSEQFDLAAHYGDLKDFESRAGADRLDLAVVAWPSLYSDSGIEATRLATRMNLGHLVLVYDYAARNALSALPRDRITALRAPLDIAALEAVAAWRFGVSVEPGNETDAPGLVAPARHYGDRELAHYAAQSSSIDCECPMHLAQLITSLVRFETYSAECESRNADDSALHGYLYNTTARARALMEQALLRVVELEDLPPPPES